MSNFIIKKMKEHEVQIAIDWAQKEGWNLGLNDAHCFYQADPNGFFIGLLDNEPIAVGSAVVYSYNFAFCGLYIVKNEYRKQGYGLKLTEERLKYIGNRITGIDGVLENVSKYERLGYVPCYKQIRYEWTGNSITSDSSFVVDINTLAFNQLNAFDQKYFQAPRSNFLQSWIHQPNTFALAFIENQQIQGYGVIRKCLIGYKIGPLFAESPEVAKTLLEALRSKISEGSVFIDTPEANPHSQTLAKHFEMSPKFEVIRMYRNGIPKLLIENIYGVTTFELG
jgi:Acetyltransferase (GNAT) domain/Acetyltransferase (GNAT) family